MSMTNLSSFTSSTSLLLCLCLCIVNFVNANVAENSLDPAENVAFIEQNTDAVEDLSFQNAAVEHSTKHTSDAVEGAYVKHRRYFPTVLNYKHCNRTAKCEPLRYSTCMGSKLPYTSTTLNLTDLKSQEEVQEKLKLYAHLQYIPACWAVIQPFLCALYMPKCVDDQVDLPTKMMCRVTLEPCRILINTTLFPDFFKCQNERLYPEECRNDIQEMRFNTSVKCLDPLIKVEYGVFYKGVENCGLRCKDNYYTENEHQQIHKLIAYCVLICIFLHGFTVITFLVDWKTANKYPALAIFYINICFLISYSGWTVQFLGSETREDIVCKKDGTLRMSEPSANENLSCVIVFVMVYYFLMAGMVWFVIFTYAWYMSSLQALGKIQDRVDKKRAYFHLIAWSLPLILTITTMALGEIDGNYVAGICFVGYVNPGARIGLLLAPLAATMVVSGYIIFCGLILLIRVKIESREVISVHSSQKIRSNIVRMGVFALFMFIFCIITFVYHGYTAENRENWEKSLHNFIMCKLTALGSETSHCRQESRPSVAMLQLQLLAVFGAGVGMASWVWCAATLHAWARYIRRKFHCEVEEPMKLQKHKIIAEMYGQRKKFNEGGRISIEFEKHSDPVGLHFDINSAASNELSTTWAAKLPRLMNRRGGIPNDATCSVSSNNHSVDSEMSYSIRHVSIESRRNSGDSQVSLKIAEVTATRKARRHRYRQHKRHNSYRRGSNSRDTKKVTGQRRLSRSSKNNSNTSIDSFLMNVLHNTQDVKSIVPNLNRRTANAGLDGAQTNLINGKLLVPYSAANQPRSSRRTSAFQRSGSEDENVSVTYSERNFNVVVSNHPNNMDLNDHLVLKSIRQGLQIQELSSSSDDDDEETKIKSSFNRSGRNSNSSRKPNSRNNNMNNSNSNNKQFKSDDESFDSSDGSVSCQELKPLVQSSVNSAGSILPEKSRESKQSKTSIDVGCQANACDIMNQIEND